MAGRQAMNDGLDNLPLEQRAYVEQRVAADGKNSTTAYLLWKTWGSVSAHNFYLGRHNLGILEVVLLAGGMTLIFASIAGVIGPDDKNLTATLLFYLVCLGPWLIFYFSDLFTIPRAVREYNDALRRKVAAEVSARGAAGN